MGAGKLLTHTGVDLYRSFLTFDLDLSFSFPAFPPSTVLHRRCHRRRSSQGAHSLHSAVPPLILLALSFITLVSASFFQLLLSSLFVLTKPTVDYNSILLGRDPPFCESALSNSHPFDVDVSKPPATQSMAIN